MTACYYIKLNFKHQPKSLSKLFCVKERLGLHMIKVFSFDLAVATICRSMNAALGIIIMRKTGRSRKSTIIIQQFYISFGDVIDKTCS